MVFWGVRAQVRDAISPILAYHYPICRYSRTRMTRRILIQGISYNPMRTRSVTQVVVLYALQKKVDPAVPSPPRPRVEIWENRGAKTADRIVPSKEGGPEAAHTVPATVPSKACVTGAPAPPEGETQCTLAAY